MHRVLFGILHASAMANKIHKLCLYILAVFRSYGKLRVAFSVRQFWLDKVGKVRKFSENSSS